MTLRNPIRIGLVVLAAGLTVSVAIAGASATWHALGHFPEVRGSADIQSSRAVATPPDLSPIVALAPFGVSVQAEGPLQATSANLTLKGVILANPARQSTALISESGGDLRAVAIGETLPGGAVLDAVAADHVVLLIGGRRETLSFPESQSSSGVAAIRAAIPGANGGVAATTQNSPQEAIDTYRQKIADNPQTVLDEFSVSASAEGYRVGPNAAPNVRRAGLMPGDLVVRVNGVAVGDVEKDRSHFETVVASGRARIEVIRNDRLLILSFPLR